MGKYDLYMAKLPLKELVSPDYNPRRITDKEFEQLKHSIREYGYISPIIVNKNNNHIVAGNQRYKALQELNRENHGKYTKVDVILVELDPLQEKAFNIAENKMGGTFDEEKLQYILDELDGMDYDMSLTGFMDVVEEVDLSSLDTGEGFEELPTFDDVGEVEYILTVKCTGKDQSDYLFEDLRKRGYNVKATQY